MIRNPGVQRALNRCKRRFTETLVKHCPFEDPLGLDSHNKHGFLIITRTPYKTNGRRVENLIIKLKNLMIKHGIVSGSSFCLMKPYKPSAKRVEDLIISKKNRIIKTCCCLGVVNLQFSDHKPYGNSKIDVICMYITMEALGSLKPYTIKRSKVP